MVQRLIYVMDPMCSWCWGFAPVAEALAMQAAAQEVTTHVVVGGLRAEQAPLAVELRQKILAHWQAVFEATGQRFKLEGALPTGFIYNTHLACRAVVVARRLAPERLLGFVHCLQRAFYAQQQDLLSPRVLAAIAQEAGLDAQAFAELLSSDESEQQTQVDYTWAQGLGIAGFPTLLAERNGQLALLTNGYQPLEVLAPLLERWLAHGRTL